LGELLSIAIYPLAGAREFDRDSSQVGPAGLDGDRAWVCCEMKAMPGEWFEAGDEGPVYNRIGRKERRQLATVAAKVHETDGALIVSVDDGAPIEIEDPLKAVERKPIHVNEFGDIVPCYYAGDGASMALTGLLRGRELRLARKHPEWLSGGGVSPAQRRVAPIHIVNEASVSELRESSLANSIGAEFDARRFRANLVVGGIEPFEELQWEGETITVGDVAMQVHRPTPRCQATGIDPETGWQMRDVPRILRSRMAQIAGKGELGNFGVYAYPLLDAGQELPVIRRGDNVALVSNAA
jgi:uncharacterized protein YcbX